MARFDFYKYPTGKSPVSASLVVTEEVKVNMLHSVKKMRLARVLMSFTINLRYHSSIKSKKYHVDVHGVD